MKIDYVIGVDGGGSGTRAQLARRDGPTLGRGHAGPSALRQGLPAAWTQVRRAVESAIADAGLGAIDAAACALGLGLSGVHHLGWRDEFLAMRGHALAADYGQIELFTDALAMLAGAHEGRPGAVVAVGTGSVGEALRADGSRASVGGWGFPAGDEGSGAWLGLQAVTLAQSAMDGRSAPGPLVHAVWDACGSTRDALLGWSGRAGQFEFAQLAPLVFEAETADPAAARLLQGAARVLDEMAGVLDPAQQLPLVLSGSIGERLASRLSAATQARRVAPKGGAADGALRLMRQALASQE